MHGRVQREGERSIQTSISWHMQPTVVPVDSSSFLKDGRRISIGDCALFKPSEDSPPFIGLIRYLTIDKENILQLGVNWLYRPSELKLGKRTLRDCAPNEIFYSFHKDEKIPAASLLHPCKVAFLPRGVKLPIGTPSFVCRRVYDITDKCLWWLTDQDYINEQQEEVDKLLYKTRAEMHATVHSGGRSPKQVNGPTSTSQAKSGSDNIQNSGSSLPSQVKGKKRERGDHAVNSVKRERSSRALDGESAHYRAEINLKSDIARITEKGGVVDMEGVEKLVQLMQSDKVEMNVDLVSRSMLAGVIAATDKVDCLNRFVQLRGLRVLDEWLQDIHKGKVGNGNSSKDGDKSVEEFLLVLLRALDKLPVNLHALQMCNIGRSVNHLRSHRNLEIHRKARGLVDTWKKRVEAEMNSLDAKSGSTQSVSVWPSKSRLPEASHGGSRTPCGSDVAMKSSITQHSTSKATSLKSLHGESISRSASSSPGPVKASSSPASGKESQPIISVDVPLIREDRGSSTNQSHNYSQSVSGKEEGRSSPAVSATMNKLTGSTLIQKNGGGFTEITGCQKENSSSRNLRAYRSTDLDKVLQSALIRERDNEGPNFEVSNHKLIVKLPTRVQSPARAVSRGSLGDHAIINSGASSPVVTDKQELFDCDSKEKGDAYPSSSWQIILSDAKNALTDANNGSRDGAVSTAVLPDAEHSVTMEDSKKPIVCTKNNQSKFGKSHEISFSPMNALIESCAKYSKAQSSLSLEDDVGMNLLASVATGEMSRSGMASPSDSTERSSRAIEEVSLGNEARSMTSPEGHIRGGQSQICNDNEKDDKDHSVLDGVSSCMDGLHLPADRNRAPSHTAPDIPAGEGNKHSGFVSTDLRSSADPGETSNKKTDISGKEIDGEVCKEIQDEKAPLSNANADDTSDSKSGATNVASYEDIIDKKLLNADERKLVTELSSSNQICDGDCKTDVNKGVDIGYNSNLKLTASVVKPEFMERDDNEKLQSNAPEHKISSETGDEVKIEECGDKDFKSCVGKFEADLDKILDTSESQCSAVPGSMANDNKNHIDANIEAKESTKQNSPPEKGFSDSVAPEAKKNDDLIGSNCVGTEADEAESTSDVAEASSAAAAASVPDEKIMFDLNEGFDVDDGETGDPADSLPYGSANVQMINSLPFAVNSVSSGHPASITVAAAAKGPFVPPEDLLRNRGELGWKGSAATSAFRPAEPRKIHEIPAASTSVLSDAATSKHGRTPLDFDLNVPDERVLEETASRDSALAFDPTADFVSNCAILLNERAGSAKGCGSGGLDLDLNRVDETNENAQCSIYNNHTGENSFVHVKPTGGLPTGDVRRDFDLNDGPGFNDAGTEPVIFNQQVRASIPPMLPSAGLRMDSTGLGSFSSWFPHGSTFSTVTVPSAIPDRGHHPFPVIPPGAPPRTFCPAANIPFTPDVYRGSVLSSSPAVSFPSGPFQFPVFPFGATFPPPSATFPLPTATFPVTATSYADSSSGPMLFMPPVNSQLLGPIGAFSSQFQRPYMVSLPDSSSNGGLENYRKWDRQGLDLNAGSGATGNEVREEMQPHSSSQIGAASSQMLAEDHARMYSVSGGVLKRKDPEGGWDNENFRYKQSSWQ